MADFDIEQLKTVLDGMIDRLDQTTGDENLQTQLAAIKDNIRKLSAHIISQASPSKTASEQKAFINNFFTKWDQENPLRDLRNSVNNLNKTVIDNPLRSGGGSGGGGGRRTGRTGRDGDDDKGGNNPLKNPKDAMRTASKFKKVLSGATDTLGAVMLAGGEIVSWLKNNAQSYRQVIGTAEGSITGIMDMRNTAAKANMSVDDMISAAERSEGVRQYGLKNFSSLQASIRNFGKSVGDFGLLPKQIEDVTGDYLTMAKQQGILNGASQDDMGKRFEKLIVVNQDMAAMMGKTAEQARQDALKASTDPNFNAALRGSGMSAESMQEVTTVVGNLPDATSRAVKELFASHGVARTEDVQNAMATNAPLQRLAQQLAAAHDQGADFDGAKMQSFVREFAAAEQQATKSSRGLDDLMSVAHYGGNGAFDLSTAIRGEMASVDPTKYGNLKANGSAASDDFSTGALNIAEVQTRAAAALDDIFNNLIDPYTQRWGTALKNTTIALENFADKGHNTAGWLGQHPKTAMATGGILGALGVAGQVGLGLFGLNQLRKTGGGMLRFLGKGKGAAGRAGLTESLAGESSIAAEGAAGAGIGALALPAAAIGAGGYGMYSGYQNLSKGGSGWWDKFKGYGESAAGGAALGAGVGSFVPGVGTVIGGVVGGLAGLGSAAYSDWTHPDDTTMKANATGQKTGSTMTDVINLDKQMVEMQHRIHFTLLDIKKASYDQLDVMREELVGQKTATDRITRLLEESNRNTKQIGALT